MIGERVRAIGNLAMKAILPVRFTPWNVSFTPLPSFISCKGAQVKNIGLYAYASACTHAYARIHTRAHARTYMHKRAHARTHPPTRHSRTSTHARTHARTHTHTHTHPHTHTHTHTPLQDTGLYGTCRETRGRLMYKLSE